MKPQFPPREVSSTGVIAEHSFGISRRSQAHVAAILRDRLYTDKPLAVLREYSANAWDANRMVGRGDRPITVVMPTPLEASLIIRDEGPGLSEEEIHVVYTQYGESTKRDRDDAVGMLGIGSKSAFAYNDSFTITSWHGGAKTVYHAVLDESQLGKVLKVYQAGRREHVSAFVAATKPPEIEGRKVGTNLEWVDLYEIFEVSDLTPYEAERAVYNEAMHRALGSPTDWTPPGDDLFRLHLSTLVKDRFLAWMLENHPDTPTGVEIKVPIVPGDIPEFERKAKDLFRYFRPLPKINIELDPPKTQWENEHGWIVKQDKDRYSYSSSTTQKGWVVVMGCVPYRININQISAQLEEAGFFGLVNRLSGGLNVPIGAVSVAANREDLEYTKLTKEAIVKGLSSLVEALTGDFDKLVDDSTKTPLQRRLDVMNFVATTDLPIPKKHQAWKTHPKGVLLYSNKAVMDAQEVLRLHAVPSGDDGGVDWQVQPGGAPTPAVPDIPVMTTSPDQIPLTDKTPKFFTLHSQVDAYGARGRRKSKQLEENPYIFPSPSVRILIKDTSKPWRGYVTSDRDLVVRFKGECSVEQVETELSAYLAAVNLTGVTVLRMSNLEYVEPARREGDGNPKHGQLCFRLIGTNAHGTLSDNWESAEREEDPEDVFVVINRFQATSGSFKGTAFYDQYKADEYIFKHLFGETMPTVWGLKSVRSHQVKSDEVDGIEYSKWREQAIKDCVARHPELRKEMDALAWTELSLGELPYIPYNERDTVASEKETLDWLRENLGDKNRVVEVLAERIKSKSILKTRKEELTKANASKPANQRNAEYDYEAARKQFFDSSCSDGPSRARRWLDVVYAHYPLLSPAHHGNSVGLAVLRLKKHRDHWLRYLQMIDTIAPRPAAPPRKIKNSQAQGT